MHQFRPCPRHRTRDNAPTVNASRVREGAGAIVVRDGGLLLVRLTYGWAAGRWVVPNGAQDPGETLAECAERELAEETGLVGKAGRLVALRSLSSPAGSDTFVGLMTAVFDGAPCPDGEETDDAQFFDLASVRELDERDRIVRMHRLIAEHVLESGSEARIQTLPARDRDGNMATAVIYLL